MKQQYRKGETITFVIPAPEGGWQDVDFTVVVFRSITDTDKVVFKKADCVQNADGDYDVTISATTTATMREGTYSVEVAATANSSTGISYEPEVFTLKDSAYNHIDVAGNED